MKNFIGHSKTILLLAAIGYILLLQMCGTGKSKPCPEIVAVKTDTQLLYKQWESAWQKPEPVKIIVPGEVPDPVVIEQHIPYPVYMSVDTAAILKDYFAKVIYRDSSLITDNAGTTYGKAYVSDTISQNRIQARQWRFDLAIPIVTVTKTVEIRPRSQLYLGFNAMFGQTAVGGNINLTLKTKRDQMFTAGAGLFGHQFYGEVGTKFKLSLKQ